MGHVFSYLHMDFVARYQAMKGKGLLYPFCFDCNGVPTQKLARDKGIEGSEAIIGMAKDMSSMYKGLFSDIRMAYSADSYNTFDQNAIALAGLSFDDLLKKDLLYKSEAEYLWCPKTKVSVSQSEVDEDGRYERSGEKVEIRKGEGWFIRMRTQLDDIREAINAIEWHPEVFKRRLLSWIDGIKYDWSISRERNYGIPIPGEKPGIVFDTWFTSSLSPQMAWSARTGGMATLECPIFDARFQAHDIIRTWALFTIVKSWYHNHQIPWKKVIISGHALDPRGRKISKSLGNFVHPSTYLEKHGVHGVRYWAAQNALGTDTKTDEQAMAKGRRLANKIRNAKRFLELNKPFPEHNGDWGYGFFTWTSLSAGELSPLMDNFEWNEAVHKLTDFFWHEFCDKYIEEAKNRKTILSSLDHMFNQMLPWFEIFIPGISVE